MGKLRKFWKSLGPGLITGAVDDDVSGIATYSIAGARQGFGTLWMMLFALPFMIAIQDMAARIGALSGCGLAGNMKRHYPVWLLAIAAVSIISANIFNIGANLYGMAGAVNLVIPLNIYVLAVIGSALVIWITIKLRYRQIVSLFKWLSLALLAYVFAFFTVSADWSQILRNTFLPIIYPDREFLTVAFAVLGTTISPYLYFWQASEEAEEVKQRRPRIHVCRFRSVSPGQLRDIRQDTIIGMVFSNFISYFIIVLAATTLFHAGAGHTIATLRDTAQALRPLAGQYTYVLFMAGILGAGLLSIPVLAGSAAYVLAELFGWNGSLDSPFNKARQFYIVMTVAVLVGLLIPLIGITPLQALFYSAIFNGLISPLLIILILHMSQNKDIVGENRIHPVTSALGHATFFMMLVGAIFIFIS